MILPYASRLICLALASFFLLHAVLSLGISFLASPLIRSAKRFRTRASADLLLAARLIPPAAALLLVTTICVPSYLRWEPQGTSEQVDFPCLAATLLGAFCLVISMRRSLRAMLVSVQCQRTWRRRGSAALTGETACVAVDGARGLVALAGIVHPRLFVSREVLRELSPEELAAAFRHERAHQDAGDNFKRLLLLLAPDVFPPMFGRLAGLEAIEREWSRFTEWAADDQAVGSNFGDSVALASALVRVARMDPAAVSSPLMASLVEARNLEERVDRLLRGNPRQEPPLDVRLVFAAATVAAVCLGGMLTRPGALETAHRLLEYLV